MALQNKKGNMPNVHKKTKVQKTFWIERDVYEILCEFLKCHNMTLTDFILNSISAQLEKEIKKHERKQKNDSGRGEI